MITYKQSGLEDFCPRDEFGNVLLDLFQCPSSKIAVNVCFECGYIARKDKDVQDHEHQEWRFWIVDQEDIEFVTHVRD